MAGGLMQLVAYGAQDVFLTGNPKVTFFQAVYKRHTNFAMENIEQTVNGSAGNSGRLSVTVARNGDLIGDMYLELTTVAGLATHSNAALDACWVAERAVTDVELSIGGQRIDKHYQKWWRMYAELSLDEAKKAQWGKMTSNPTGAIGKVYLPLIFFFNRNPGLYLPLIALQYHEVRLDFDLSADFQSYFASNTPKVWGNYVYLDTEERRRFAQKGHEYLIEQVQHTGTDSVAVGTTKQVRLSYNHPVKELVWCFNAGGSNAQMWNFCSNADAADVVVECNPDLAITRQAAEVGANVMAFINTSLAGCPMLALGGASLANVSARSWLEDGASSATASVGPLSSFKLVLNGQDRFKEQDGKYFNQIQAYNHHSGNPCPGVYSYSFALKPEEHQPTGTCNFSRIDNAQVAVTIKPNCESSTMHMFATNYNVLRIQSGMGGLAFSN
jgi:hypothetical protein